jgi:hypothetical protein
LRSLQSIKLGNIEQHEYKNDSTSKKWLLCRVSITRIN